MLTEVPIDGLDLVTLENQRAHWVAEDWETVRAYRDAPETIAPLWVWQRDAIHLTVLNGYHRLQALIELGRASAVVEMKSAEFARTFRDLR